MFLTAATAELSNGPSPLDLATVTEVTVPSGNMPICSTTVMFLRAEGGRAHPSAARAANQVIETAGDLITLLICQGLLALRRIRKQIRQGLGLFLFGRFTRCFYSLFLGGVSSSFLLRIFGGFLLRLVCGSLFLGVFSRFFLRIFSGFFLGVFSGLFLGLFFSGFFGLFL
jgi:hypothetical protein